MSDMKGGSTVAGFAIYHNGNRENHAGRDTIERVIEGEVYLTNLMYYRVSKACKVVDVIASLSALPSGQSFKIDVRKNGAASTDSVFSGDVPIEILTSQSLTNGIYANRGTLDSALVDLVDGDVLQFVITQVGTTLSGADLLLQVRLV